MSDQNAYQIVGDHVRPGSCQWSAQFGGFFGDQFEGLLNGVHSYDVGKVRGNALASGPIKNGGHLGGHEPYLALDPLRSRRRSVGAPAVSAGWKDPRASASSSALPTCVSYCSARSLQKKNPVQNVPVSTADRFAMWRWAATEARVDDRSV